MQGYFKCETVISESNGFALCSMKDKVKVKVYDERKKKTVEKTQEVDRFGVVVLPISENGYGAMTVYSDTNEGIVRGIYNKKVNGN